MKRMIQNQIEFNHPLQFSIALSAMAGTDANGGKIAIDFNTIAPIPQTVIDSFADKTTQQLVWWGTGENAIDTEINKEKLTIRFKTERCHPKGIVRALHEKLPGGWTWKFASNQPIGFEIGYYTTNGRIRNYTDLSCDSITNEVLSLTDELWNPPEREDDDA